MKKALTISIFLLLIIFSVQAQDDETKERNWSLDGYLTNMQSVMFDSIDNSWTSDNLLHNRLNFRWYPSEMFTVAIDARTRLLSGETVKYFPGYAESIEKDNGLIDLNTNIFSENSFILNTMLDRAYVSFEKGNLNITAGRQRINWGRSFVWNPNDIFNSYSFFDFDYAEKPGSDALRAQYYTSPTSSAEFVVKADSSNNISAAGLYRFTVGRFDIQTLAGIINGQDYVIGTGWEGYIKSVSLRGEASYVHPKNNFADTSGLFVASVSADYSFSNSLMIQLEFLYNQQPETGGISSFGEYYTQTASIKTLSFTEYNVFANISYPVSPLFKTGLSAMYYPKIDGYFIGPNLAYSLNDNVDFSFTLQSFAGKFPNALTGEMTKQQITLAFLRLKVNF